MCTVQYTKKFTILFMNQVQKPSEGRQHSRAPIDVIRKFDHINQIIVRNLETMVLFTIPASVVPFLLDCRTPSDIHIDK